MSPLVPNMTDAAALGDELVRFRVVDPDRLAEFPGGGAVALAEFLVRGGALTAFQAERALAGEVRMVALGPYRLTGTHRVTALGPVFRAEPAGGGTGGAVAVRVFPLRSLWRAKQAQQLARTLSALPPHPSAVPLAAAGSANGFHYLAWPLVGGPTLADRVAEGGPQPPGRVAGWLAGLLDALAGLHARGVVHGVITPQTVATPADGPARLLDLGVGTILADDLTAGEALLDTLSAALAAAEVLDFAAPERVADPTRPTPAADLYAVAAVGYFALTGRPPFPGRTLPDRLLARESGAPAPVGAVNPAVPPELAAVLDRMLLPDPADRFPRPEDARLELVAAGSPAPAQTVLLAPSAGGSGSGSSGGSVSWGSAGTAARPAQRDDSDDSITFDLPDAPPSVPWPVQPVDTPSAIMGETQPSSGALPVPQSVRDSRLDARKSSHKMPSPVVPEAQPSPARAETPTMAKTSVTDPAAGPPPAPPANPTDPRSTLPTPVQWHTAGPETPAEPPADPDDQRPSVLWRRLKRNLLFWAAPTDVVRASVFGPVGLTPGATARVCVVLHVPEAAESVRTLVRAFEHEAELLSSALLVREVARGSPLSVHLSVTNAGVDRSLVSFTWRGQPHRVNFDLHVPWESPCGPAPGLVSVGQENVRIGKAEFHLRILPRKG